MKPERLMKLIISLMKNSKNLKFDLDALLTLVNVDGYLELLKFIETKYNKSSDDENYKKILGNALALTFENLNFLKFSGKAFSITKLTEDQKKISKIESCLNEEIQIYSNVSHIQNSFEDIVNKSSKYSKKLEKCFKKLKNRFSSEMVNIYEAKKREKENPGSSSGGSSGSSSGDKIRCTSILKK
ncbi:hypothetical protein BCR32DRAFT_288288 [Anaeromyces robustus]|uniref:Uncharacterized protein n=1 Tax=Anaeromyces robustus TaxID=1754192 RepID=A0A1Y1V3B2_9FUNG|nr:hypothetical protein BCR32DRAFT_288288 [Anaeromyces robustus]|eukprot:ORX44970.1 hypothetical protein BCR32DRAFT_288288 [Anaeromyces robustus]